MLTRTRSIGSFVICALTLLFVSPGPATAWWDWLKTGEKLLGTTTKEQTSVSSLLSEEDVIAGLKDALRVGTETVVSQLGTTDGFNADPDIHIPLPEKMESVKTALGTIGMSSMLDDLELKLNRAAEEATPPAKELFWNAIEEMTLDDAMGIYEGSEDSATRYFETKMSSPLAEKMRPIVDQALAEVGAVKAYDGVMGQYSTLPFVPDVKEDLTTYVIDQGMAGIFHYIAEEETAIRQDPAKRTTDILQKVFGAK